MILGLLPLGVITAIVLIIVVIILFIVISLWKTVGTVPSITVTVGAASYAHGATGTVTGIVSTDVGIPAAGETIALSLEDTTGASFPIGTATSGADGSYSASFTVPTTVAPGTVTVTATDAALNVTGTATFTY